MRIQFEGWVKSQSIEEEAESLFEEAILCYKASAYRAALLFSYLGFQTIVKHRILKANKPSGIQENQWKGIQQKLLDDDKWDNQVYEALQMKPPRTVFGLSDDIRNQLTYWKNRRNDCAHSKSNKIDFAHVEAFWLFIRSNLAKCLVSGSKESLLNEIRILFNRSLTPAGADQTHILEQLPYALEANEISDFFDEMDQVFKTRDRYQQSQLDDIARLLNGMFDIGSNSITQGLVGFLKLHRQLLLEFLWRYPNKVQFFSDDSPFIRQLWHEELFTHQSEDAPIYCAFLRNNLIPKPEIEEAHETVIRTARPFSTDIEAPCIDLLENTGFFNILKMVAFGENFIDRFSWANENVNLVVFYLSKYTIDSTVARSIHSTFAKRNNPRELKPALEVFFAQNRDKSRELSEQLEELDLEPPRYLSLPS